MAWLLISAMIHDTCAATDITDDFSISLSNMEQASPGCGLEVRKRGEEEFLAGFATRECLLSIVLFEHIRRL